MADHAKAQARFEALSNSAAVARGSTTLEDEADKALAELTELETLMLSTPADGPASLRFKLKLWGDSRTEGFESEWRVFAADCERILSEAGQERRRA